MSIYLIELNKKHTNNKILSSMNCTKYSKSNKYIAGTKKTQTHTQKLNLLNAALAFISNKTLSMKKVARVQIVYYG